MNYLLASLTLCSFAAAAPAMAMPGMQSGSGDQAQLEEQARKSAEQFYQKADANHDNKLTKEEFMKALPNMKEQAFYAIDTNKDGSISLEEWMAFTVRHAQGKQTPAPSSMHQGQAHEPLPTVTAPTPPQSK